MFQASRNITNYFIKFSYQESSIHYHHKIGLNMVSIFWEFTIKQKLCDMLDAQEDSELKIYQPVNQAFKIKAEYKTGCHKQYICMALDNLQNVCTCVNSSEPATYPWEDTLSQFGKQVHSSYLLSINRKFKQNKDQIQIFQILSPHDILYEKVFYQLSLIVRLQGER